MTLPPLDVDCFVKSTTRLVPAGDGLVRWERVTHFIDRYGEKDVYVDLGEPFAPTAE